MVNKKRILVLGINCFPELTGIGKYSGEMVTWLAENGHETTMITAPPYYPNWKVQKPYNGNWYKKECFIDGKLIIYRCPLYVPSNPKGIKRLLHEASFFLSASLVVFLLLFKKKQDIIFSISPPFHLGFLALLYRFFKGGKIVYHVQDLQIEAAKELNILNSARMFDVLFAMERSILNKVNVVSTISDGMIKKVQQKVNKKVLFFPNWVDTENFHPLANRKMLKVKWGYDADDWIVLYSGSIGEKQGLDALIRTAFQVKQHKSIKFIICGTGPYKEELIRLAKADNLDNIKFMPLQDHQVFNEFLNMVDVHLIMQRGNASDLVMPSKLTTILAVGGNALVTANEGTTLHSVINKNKMGEVIDAEDEFLLAKTISEMANNDNIQGGVNARLYAEQFLDKRNILPKLMSDIS